MPEERFDIIFAGELIEGRDPAAARERIRRMFKASDAQLERLFSGQPVAIKKGVDMEAAAKYRLAFRQAGALIRVRSGAAPSRGEKAEARPAAMTLLPANSGSLEEFAPRLEPEPLPDISDLDMSAPGAALDETPAPAPARIDTGELDLVEGREWTLEDCRPPPPPRVMPDIDDLDFAPLDDTSHIPPQPPPGPLPDTDDLELAAPEDESHIPPRPPPVPLQDTTGMELEEPEQKPGPANSVDP